MAENNPLYLEMPVLEYLQYVAALQSIDKAIIPSRIREMIRICGLDMEKHKKIGELSKGYRQRVGLAQAMIHDPEILSSFLQLSGYTLGPLSGNYIHLCRRLLTGLPRHVEASAEPQQLLDKCRHEQKRVLPVLYQNIVEGCHSVFPLTWGILPL